jgi:p-aminobenzoyl-glutamate transporter AbgT
MEQKNDNLRERLLSHLPQPENLAAYREETASLLAKHEKALSTEKWSAIALAYCVLALFFFCDWIMKYRPLDTGAQFGFLGGILVFVLFAGILVVKSLIYASQVATLKELKQVQLQVLELQASLVQRSGSQTGK